MAGKNKKLLRLSWYDDTGEIYHTQDLPTKAAQELLKRSTVFRVSVTTKYGTTEHSFSIVSHAQVSRCTRATKGERYDRKGWGVLITLATD
jgi:hypothetical protein